MPEGSRLLCLKSFLTVYRQYLLFLDSHPEEYLKYLAWKGHYEVGSNQPISIFISVFRWNADRLGPATCVRGFTRSKTGSWGDLRSSKISQRFSSIKDSSDTHADGVGQIILLTIEARMMLQIKTMTHYCKLRCGTPCTATPVGIIHKDLWSEH